MSARAMQMNECQKPLNLYPGNFILDFNIQLFSLKL